jgi:hypothetical protein
MDPVKILKRAWHILWSYRALWVFGLILALAAGSASSQGSNNSNYQFNPTLRKGHSRRGNHWRGIDSLPVGDRRFRPVHDGFGNRDGSRPLYL